MAKGMALHLGLNSVDPGHYQGWSGDLVACEADANSLAAITGKKGFTAIKLLTRKATRKAALDALANAAAKLAKGDIFVLTYSGHGGQIPDIGGDEDDARDETWCLYDGELVDDELYAAFAQFKAGVRIFVLSDSCHSGTVTREAYYRARPASAGEPTRHRNMPRDVAARVYQANRGFYDGIDACASRKKESADVAAAVILISGCQDNQLSSDGDFNGLFTSRLLEVWNGGKCRKAYPKFARAIVDLMPPDQTPNYYVVGAVDKAFAKQVPFTI